MPNTKAHTACTLMTCICTHTHTHTRTHTRSLDIHTHTHMHGLTTKIRERDREYKPAKSPDSFQITLMVTEPATMPSTVDSAKGSKWRSTRRMKSGLRTYPDRPLYSKMPRLICMARSASTQGKWHFAILVLAGELKRSMLPEALPLQRHSVKSKQLRYLFCGTSSWLFLHVGVECGELAFQAVWCSTLSSKLCLLSLRSHKLLSWLPCGIGWMRFIITE